MLEKNVEKEAKLEVESKLNAATIKIKHYQKNKESVQDLRRRVNDLTGIEVERDRAVERSVLVAMNSSNNMSWTMSIIYYYLNPNPNPNPKP